MVLSKRREIRCIWRIQNKGREGSCWIRQNRNEFVGFKRYHTPEQGLD